MRNVSEQVCAVGRTTALIVRTHSGRSVTAKVMPKFFLPDRVVPTDLRPHTAVSSALLTFNACNGYDGGAAGAVMSAGVSLVLGGADLPMGQPDGRPVNVRCRPGVEPLGRHVGQPLAVTAGTVYALTARFQFTVAPRAGEIAWPLLRLQNPSAKPVPLSPCPSYMIGLGVLGAKGPEYNYRLNCDQFTLIQPGQSLTYQLRVPVPHLRGPAKLYWQMLPRSTDPALPAAAIPVQIA